MFGRKKSPKIDRRVAIAAAALDEALPGWHNRIDLGSLDMVSMTDCIFGQVGQTSEVRAWAKRKYTRMHADHFPFHNAVEFVACQTGHHVSVSNSMLHTGGKAYWIRAISERRATDAKAVADEAKRARQEAKCRAKARRHLRIVQVPVEAKPEYELVA